MSQNSIRFEFVNRPKAEDRPDFVYCDYTTENVKKCLSGSKAGIARAIVRHFEWCFALDTGGLITPDGDRYVYKSTTMLQEEVVKASKGVMADCIEDRRTFDRALLGLVQLRVLERRWVRVEQGITSLDMYAYKKGPNWNDVIPPSTEPDTEVDAANMEYREYLQTPQWQVKRQTALKAASHACQVCNAKGVTLNVHHRTYERLGREKRADLIVLCQSCHALFHRNSKLAHH